MLNSGTTARTLCKVFLNPKLLIVGLRRYLLFGSIRRDEETMHLVHAWSSGSLPRIVLRSAFPGIDKCDSVTVRKPESRVVGWSLDLQELVHILSVVRYLGVLRVLEIGTYDGFTAVNIAANLPENGRLHTLDLPPERESVPDDITNRSNPAMVGAKFRNEAEASLITQLYGDSTKTDWVDFGAPFDMIFIDGSHSYQYVKSDSENALKHLRPGGVIFWHDYGHVLDVSRAVDELSERYPIFAIAGTRLACYRGTSPQLA